MSFYKKNKYGFKFKGNKKMKSGNFEPEVSNYLMEQFKTKNNIFIDIGAHQGYYSCLGNANKVKRVYSIEPDNLNRKLLKLNLKKNGFLKKTKIIDVALGSKNDEIKLYGFGTGTSAIPNWSGNVSKRIKKIPVQRLDSILSMEHPLKNALVKIDVEGYELEVIKGSYETISSAQNTNFLIELSLQRKEGNTPLIGEKEKILEIIQLFANQSYGIFTLEPNNKMLYSLIEILPNKLLEDLIKYGSGNYIFEKTKSQSHKMDSK